MSHDVAYWLRVREPDDFDDESIGLFATSPPALDDLARALSAEYEFLRDLTHEDQTLAACNGRDRTLLLRLLAGLPNTRFPRGTCW